MSIYWTTYGDIYLNQITNQKFLLFLSRIFFVCSIFFSSSKLLLRIFGFYNPKLVFSQFLSGHMSLSPFWIIKFKQISSLYFIMRTPKIIRCVLCFFRDYKIRTTTITPLVPGIQRKTSLDYILRTVSRQRLSVFVIGITS